MAFVRPKVVEGRTYYQLVHNYRAAGKHRQKVLCHLGKHSSLAPAIEDKSREEEELRNKTAALFRKMTEIKQSIIDLHSELIGREIPSLEEVDAMEEEAHESFVKYLREYPDHPYEHPERRKRRELWFRMSDLYSSVSKYHSLKDEACWYDDKANEAQEKKGKLTECKEKYPHL